MADQAVGSKTFLCALCARKVGRVNRHHLVPKSEGGRVMVDLCLPCHKTLHNFYTNRTLAKELSSIDNLRRTPEIARYLEWVRKQRDGAVCVRASRFRR